MLYLLIAETKFPICEESRVFLSLQANVLSKIYDQDLDF